jgi:hypothetical protein
VQLRWTAGRSDNRAHWTFHPGAHGGTVTVLDELAADLIDPAAGKPLRTVRPVTALAEQALQLDEPPARRAEPARRAAPEPPQFEEPAAAEPEAQPASEVAEATGTTGTTDNTAAAAPARRGRNNRPIVPSWEDVLLGVRSNRS